MHTHTHTCAHTRRHTYTQTQKQTNIAVRFNYFSLKFTCILKVLRFNTHSYNNKWGLIILIETLSSGWPYSENKVVAHSSGPNRIHKHLMSIKKSRLLMDFICSQVYITELVRVSYLSLRRSPWLPLIYPTGEFYFLCVNRLWALFHTTLLYLHTYTWRLYS